MNNTQYNILVVGCSSAGKTTYLNALGCTKTTDLFPTYYLELKTSYGNIEIKFRESNDTSIIYMMTEGIIFMYDHSIDKTQIINCINLMRGKDKDIPIIKVHNKCDISTSLIIEDEHKISAIKQKNLLSPIIGLLRSLVVYDITLAREEIHDHLFDIYSERAIIIKNVDIKNNVLLYLIKYRFNTVKDKLISFPLNNSFIIIFNSRKDAEDAIAEEKNMEISLLKDTLI